MLCSLCWKYEMHVLVLMSHVAPDCCQSWEWIEGRTLSRLVYARMRRSTDRQASVPLFTKRTISMQGTLSITILASTFSSSQGAPYEVPYTCVALVQGAA